MSKLVILQMIIHNLINIDVNQINLSINTNNTRAIGLRLVLPAPRTNIMLHSFVYTADKMWNALPENVICASSYCIFLNYVCLAYVLMICSGGTM